MAGLYLVVLGGDFIRVWINNPSFDWKSSGVVLTVLMASHFVFLPIRGVALPILMGLGRAARPAFALVISGVLNLVIGIALIGPYGLTGVAIGIAVADLLFAVYVLRLVSRDVKVPWQRYVRYVAGKASLGAIPVLLLLLALKRALSFGGWPSVLLAGIASTALFVVIWIVYVYRNDPYIDAGARLKRLFAFARKPMP
jgi:O-antigen/teichoic acid export membrane protein